MNGERTEGGITRIDEYWGWVTVALFLLITVDLLTTLFAAAEFGPEAESNPVMAWLLEQSLGTLVAANVGAVVLVSVFFYGLMRLLERTPEQFRRRFAIAIELWLGLLVAAGLTVFANNLSVIVHGESLI